MNIEEKRSQDITVTLLTDWRAINAAIRGREFCELPHDIKLALISAYLNGARLHSDSGWDKSCMTYQPNFHPRATYGIIIPEPKAKPSIDWSHVAPQFRYLARDNGGAVYVYVNRPEQKCDYWAAQADMADAYGFASYQPGDCDWDDSLIDRLDDPDEQYRLSARPDAAVYVPLDPTNPDGV